MTKPGLNVPESIQLSEYRSQDDRSECASTESVAEMDRNIDTVINSETGTFIISKKKTESLQEKDRKRTNQELSCSCRYH